MAPKKDTKKDDKKEKPKPMNPELKALIEKEKAITKVNQPDKSDLEALNTKVQEKIAKLQEDLKGVNDQIAAKTTGKEDFFKAKDEIRAKLDEYSAKIDALMKTKQDAFSSIKEKQNEGRNKKQELEKMKRELGFDSIDNVDDAIRVMENKISHDSLTLNEEKALMKKIAELKKSKPKVNKVLGMTAGTDEQGITAARGNIDDTNKELSELRDAKKIQSEALKKLQDARATVMKNIPHLFEAREKVNAEIRELISQRNAKRDEFNTANKEYNDYLWEVRRVRNDRAKIEREERQKEWESRNNAEKEAAGPPPPPFAMDLMTLDSTIVYLKSLLPKEAAEDKAAEKKEEAAGVLVPKHERTEVYEFAPTKGKKKGKQSKAAAPSKKLITHSFESLATFDKYKVSPPANLSVVAETITAVEKVIEEYKEKQTKAVAEQERKAKLSPAEKAAEEPPAEEAKEEAVAA